MKKLISVLMILVLSLSALCCAEAVDVSGEWFLNAVEAEGAQLDPSMLGIEMCMTLNADGTAVLDFSGEIDNGSWSVSGTQVSITDSLGETMVAEITADALVIAAEEMGGSMIFGREKTAPETYVPGAPRTDATIEEYNGTWTAVMLDMMGIQVPMSSVGMSMVITIDGEKATVATAEEGEEVTLDAAATLEGGVLTIAGSDEAAGIALQLLDDGKVSYSEESEGMVIAMYFEKTA